jgi:hypothetical protein
MSLYVSHFYILLLTAHKRALKIKRKELAVALNPVKQIKKGTPKSETRWL